MKLATVFGFGSRRRLGDVRFDGSHKGRSDSGPPDSQISLSLGGSFPASDPKGFGPGAVGEQYEDTRSHRSIRTRPFASTNDIDERTIEECEEQFASEAHGGIAQWCSAKPLCPRRREVEIWRA